MYEENSYQLSMETLLFLTQLRLQFDFDSLCFHILKCNIALKLLSCHPIINAYAYILHRQIYKFLTIVL